MPFGRMTEIDVVTTEGRALRPDLASPHTAVIALSLKAASCVADGAWATEIARALVTSQPELAMNQPVLVSRNGVAGAVSFRPSPQSTATSAVNSVTTIATAGFARSSAS